MEVILKETVDTLGQEGDIVKVKDGYARNYLIPKKIAVLANKGTLAQLEQEKAAIESRREKTQQGSENLAKKLSGVTVEIEQRVGEEDKLFGSVTASDIADKLVELDIEIDKRRILLTEPIKTIGETVVPVKVGFQMNTEITVKVVPIEEE